MSLAPLETSQLQLIITPRCHSTMLFCPTATWQYLPTYYRVLQYAVFNSDTVCARWMAWQPERMAQAGSLGGS